MVFEDKGVDGVEDSGMEFWEKESGRRASVSFRLFRRGGGEEFRRKERCREIPHPDGQPRC